jgi:hypothetical protein
MVAHFTIVITMLAVWWCVPSLSEIASQRAEVATVRLADLNQRGARTERSTSGPKKRFSVRIDPKVGSFGDANKDETSMIPEGH